MSFSIYENPLPSVVRKDTKRFQIQIKDLNDNLVDPDFCYLTFVKPGGAYDSPKGRFLATRLSEGVYFVDWMIPTNFTLGEWIRYWEWFITGVQSTYQSPVIVYDLTEAIDSFDV